MRYTLIVLVTFIFSLSAQATLVYNSKIDLGTSVRLNHEEFVSSEFDSSPSDPLASLSASIEQNVNVGSASLLYKNSMKSEWLNENKGTVFIQGSGWKVENKTDFQISLDEGLGWSYSFSVEDNSIFSFDWDMFFDQNNSYFGNFGLGISVSIRKNNVLEESVNIRSVIHDFGVGSPIRFDFVAPSPGTHSFNLMAGNVYEILVRNASNVGGGGSSNKTSFMDANVNWEIITVPAPSVLLLMLLGVAASYSRRGNLTTKFCRKSVVLFH